MKTRAITGIMVTVLILTSAFVNPATASQSQIPEKAGLGVLEYHMCHVSPGVEYVGSEPRDLRYELGLQLRNEKVGTTLHGIGISIQDIADMPIDPGTGKLKPGCSLRPHPTSIGHNWMYWDLGDLQGSEMFWDQLHLYWQDQGRIIRESLGFSALRTVEPKEIPADEDTITQFVTIEMVPEDKDKELFAGVQYEQTLVSAELLEYSHSENVIEWHFDYGLHAIEWRVLPPLEQVYVFHAKFKLTREPGVAGALEIIPRNRADLRAVTNVSQLHTNTVSAFLEDGVVKVTTTDNVDWHIRYESPSRTVLFASREVARHRLAVASSGGGSVSAPGEGTFTYEPGVLVSLAAVPDDGYRFDGWTGNVTTIANPNAASTTISMNGDYSITANFQEEEPPPLLPQTGCFIATAAYGTPMAEEIQILRQFRDQYLVTNPLGRAFVDLYYRLSPPIAKFINEHPEFKPVVRAGLVPTVAMSTIVINASSAQKAATIGLLVLLSVALAVWLTRRRRTSPGYDPR